MAGMRELIFSHQFELIIFSDCNTISLSAFWLQSCKQYQNMQVFQKVRRFEKSKVVLRMVLKLISLFKIFLFMGWSISSIKKMMEDWF